MCVSEWGKVKKKKDTSDDHQGEPHNDEKHCKAIRGAPSVHPPRTAFYTRLGENGDCEERGDVIPLATLLSI